MRLRMTIILTFLLLSHIAIAEDLTTRADFQTALYDRLHVDTLHDGYWTTDRVRRAINAGVKFVQQHSRYIEREDTIQLVSKQVKYALPSGVSRRNLEAVCVYEQDGDLRALIKRPIQEFGKTDLKANQIYAVKADTIFIDAHPDGAKPLILFWYEVQDDLAYDTTVVWLDYDLAVLALEMAYAHCTWMRKDYQSYLDWKQGVLQEIYGLVPPPKEEPQKWGLEGEE